MLHLATVGVIFDCLGTALSKPIETEIEPWHLKAHLLISLLYMFNHDLAHYPIYKKKGGECLLWCFHDS